MGFQLSGGEGKNDITVEETPGQNQGAFPSISAILFNEDRTLVRIRGDRAGYEHTTLTCEHAATGKKVNVKECDDNGIIGTMYSSDFESGQYKVTLTAYDSNGAVLGMASMLFMIIITLGSHCVHTWEPLKSTVLSRLRATTIYSG